MTKKQNITNTANLEAHTFARKHESEHGWALYDATVSVTEFASKLGSLSRNPNPRESKGNTVVEGILETLAERPELFVLANGGIVVSVNSIDDTDPNNVQVTWDEQAPMHGIIDGGHTALALVSALRTRDEIGGFDRIDDAAVSVQFVTGLTREILPEVAKARNTSASVPLRGIVGLSGGFDRLAKKLRNVPLSTKGNSEGTTPEEILGYVNAYEGGSLTAGGQKLIRDYEQKKLSIAHADKAWKLASVIRGAFTSDKVAPTRILVCLKAAAAYYRAQDESPMNLDEERAHLVVNTLGQYTAGGMKDTELRRDGYADAREVIWDALATFEEREAPEVIEESKPKTKTKTKTVNPLKEAVNLAKSTQTKSPMAIVRGRRSAKRTTPEIARALKKRTSAPDVTMVKPKGKKDSND